MKGGREPLVIPDLTKNKYTKDMEVTKAFGGGCLIGVPIVFKNGKKFGTLCGMDNKPFAFTEKDVQLFESLAALITYVLEVDDSYQQILTLSAPVISICKGVASMPIVGKIEQERAKEITRIALKESERLELEHLVIDVSGIVEIGLEETELIIGLVKILKLVGVNTMFTGMRPETAKKYVNVQSELEDVKFSGTLEKGLSLLGIEYTNNNKT